MIRASRSRSDNRPRPWLAWPILALLLVLSLSLTACQGRGSTRNTAPDVQIDLTLSPSPPTVGPAQLTIVVASSTRGPIEGAKVDIEGTMAHAGMKPAFFKATGVGNGRYVVRDFAFSMAGDWIVNVVAELPDGGLAERSFKLDNVKSG